MASGIPHETRGIQLNRAIEALRIELAGRARVEHALRESQSRLSAIVSTAAEGIITIDRRGTIDSFNPAAERIFGYTAKEIIGQNVGVLMPSPYRENHGKYIASYLRTGERKIIGIGREVVGVRKDGSAFPMGLAVGEGADGAGPVFTGIVRDLTASKESENQLRTSERLATIGTLAAGLGHDMNNVLLPIRAHLNAAIAAAGPPCHARVRNSVKNIQKGIDYLQQLADGLHFLAADPEQDDGGGPRRSTDLARWWSQTGALLSKPVPRHVRVITAIPGVKGGRSSLRVDGNGRRLPEIAMSQDALTQAVLNLVVNAGQAIPPPDGRAGRNGVVKISAAVVPGEDGEKSKAPVVRLCIKDNGTGMSEEVRRRAFDMFFTTKPRGLGTGLGLPLVARLVKNVGGTVHIESRVGTGTTVILDLPTVKTSKGASTSAGARTAVVSVGDARTAGVLKRFLRAAHVSIVDPRDAETADLWVVEPGRVGVVEARAWRRTGPEGARRLVVIGPLSAAARAAWSKLAAVIIDSPGDLLSLRDGIAHATAHD